MGTLAAAGALHSAGNLPRSTHLSDGGNILPPRTVVKINGKKPAGIIGKDRIQTHRIPAIGIPAAEMVENHLIAQRNQLPILAFGATPLGLDADTRLPLIGTHRSITGLFRLGTVPPPSKGILPPTEQTAEQLDLFSRSTAIVDCCVGDGLGWFRNRYTEFPAKFPVFCFQLGNTLFQFFISLFPVHYNRSFKDFPSYIIGTYGEESRKLTGNFDYGCLDKGNILNIQ